jgi:uncharacterized protein involved in outer membrane biogenesis
MLKKVMWTIAIGLIVLVAARNMIGIWAITRGLKAATGVDIYVGGLDLGLSGSHVGAKDIKILNPKGFTDKTMLSVPELYVEYDLGSFMSGHAHLKQLRVHVAELMIVKNIQGLVNVNALRPVQEKKTEEQAKAKKTDTEPKKPSKPMKLQVDLLEYEVGKITYKDYSSGPEPNIKTQELNLKGRIENITSPQAVISAILTQALTQSTLGQLANVDVGALKATAQEGVSKAASEFIEGAAGAAGLGGEAAGEGAAVLKSFLSGVTGSDKHQEQKQ